MRKPCGSNTMKRFHPRFWNKAQKEALNAFDECMKDENYVQRKSFFKNLRDKFEGKQ